MGQESSTAVGMLEYFGIVAFEVNSSEGELESFAQEFSQPMHFQDPGLLSPEERMHAIDHELSHVWMVRTFLKHCDESAEDEELASVHRDLYDFMLALGPSYEAGDVPRYLRLAKKKFRRLAKAAELFHEIQPEVSGHMNFKMASHSLRISVERIGRLLDSMPPLQSVKDSESTESDEDDSMEQLNDD